MRKKPLVGGLFPDDLPSPPAADPPPPAPAARPQADPGALPRVLYWLVGKVVLTSLPCRAVDPPHAPRRVVKPFVPAGATAWRLRDADRWRSMASLPVAWRPAFDAPFVEEDDDEIPDAPWNYRRK